MREHRENLEDKSASFNKLKKVRKVFRAYK